MKQQKIVPMPEPKNKDLVCVEYNDKIVIGKYKGIEKGFLKIDNAITIGMNKNARIQYMKGVYPLNGNKISFRWNGQTYIIPKNDMNMTVSYGIEYRSLVGHIDFLVGVNDVREKLLSTGNQEIADIISNYKRGK